MSTKLKKVKKVIPDRTALTFELWHAESSLSERITRGKALLEQRPRDAIALGETQQLYYNWDDYNKSLLEKMFSTDEFSREYSYWGISSFTFANFNQQVDKLVEEIKDKIRRLESIVARLPLYADEDLEESPSQDDPGLDPCSRKVFVVHGRNSELKETVARYLSLLELDPVILHEQPSGGMTIIEKFEANSKACYAVILLTPDDVGALCIGGSSEMPSKRARQNVIFEWGFFVAHLGRRRVCALVAEGVELPSDIDGIVFVPLDHDGAWKLLLARELKAGDVKVDLNRIL